MKTTFCALNGENENLFSRHPRNCLKSLTGKNLGTHASTYLINVFNNDEHEEVRREGKKI